MVFATTFVSFNTENQTKVIEIADCLFSFKIKDDVIELLAGGADSLLERCKNAATTMRNPHDSVPFHDANTPPEHGTIQAIRAAGNNVMDVIDEMTNFMMRAKAAGFLPPRNPISEIGRFNEDRELVRPTPDADVRLSPGTIDKQLADDLMFNLKIILDLVEKEKDGELDLQNRKKESTGKGAQLSSYSVSLTGFDLALTDGMTDLLSFLPDIDKIKRKRIREAFGTLSFTNRIPKIVFTANYEPDGISRGTVIGWKKILDASGYVLTRHSVFDNEDRTFEFSNEDLVAQYDFIKEYVKEWVLSFYDQIDEDMIYAVLDKDVKSHNFYTYKIKGQQAIRTDKNFVFNVDMSPLVMSKLQLNDIQNEMDFHVKQTLGKKIQQADFDDISPYPFISKRFYSHDKYDWILAAMNVKAAIERGDDRATVRKFSYLGSRLTFLREQIEAGKFFRPIDPNDVVRSVGESISTFGVSQTLTEVIENTGLDFFFGPKESPQEDTFKKATAVLDETDLGGITNVLAAIDPETATIDVESLVTNLLLVSQGKQDLSDVDESSSPTEIDVPKTKGTGELAEDPLQFVGDFDPSQEVLDLTSFEGISEFVRIIRLFFDQSPNRTVFGAGPSSEDPDVTDDGPLMKAVLVLPDGTQKQPDDVSAVTDTFGSGGPLGDGEIA